MTLKQTTPMPASTSRVVLYGRVWRWHFFAGLLCLPILLSLAITGSLYLFRGEINDWIYHDERLIAPSTQPAMALQRLTQQVLMEYPGELKLIQTPATSDRSLGLLIKQPHGETVQVLVNPYSGQILGAHAESQQWELIVKQLHSLTLVGTWANWLVEIVAGWTMVLVISGFYLWWPRGQNANVIKVRGSPQKRVWWRDVHAVTGLAGGGIVLFLALTGMPWSAFWGQQFGKISTAYGLGFPAYLWAKVPQSDIPLETQGDVPWTLEKTTLPISGQQGVSGAVMPIGLDNAQHLFTLAGLKAGYSIRLPMGPGGVYTALQFPADATQERVVHIDQYSGKVLIDTGYAEYGAVAKVTEWGTSVHQGKQYGLVSQLVMLVGCVALILLVISSVTMWGKRRASGQRMAPPPKRQDHKLTRNIAIITVALGVLFPLLGASIMAALIFDTIWQFTHREVRQ
ncbi:MAG: PepSY-associated TM helix domain-containing protein [Methylophilus sp.]|uniref:PepSY-associated TM helix domain-containing protein n=1 Tax=Methylophilus sp. TaxID=29541 RepID=UPI003FA11E56